MMIVPLASFLVLAAPPLAAPPPSPAQVKVSWARGLVEIHSFPTRRSSDLKSVV